MQICINVSTLCNRSFFSFCIFRWRSFFVFILWFRPDIDNETWARFRLKPGGLRWHDFIIISNLEQVTNLNRVECNCCVAIFLASFLKFLMPANATYKFDTGIFLNIFNPKYRCKNFISDDLRVKLANCWCGIQHAFLKDHSVPRLFYKKTELVFSLYLCIISFYWLDIEILSDFLQEFFIRQPTQRLEDAVVVENLQVVSWEKDCHEEVKTLISCHSLAFSYSCCSQILSDFYCSCSPVVTICHIQRANFWECLLEKFCVFRRASP